MNVLKALSFLGLFTAASSAALAGPVNSHCPVSKEPIAESAGTVKHGDHEIGLCCPGCGDAFNAWEDTRKNEFVRVSLASHTAQHDGHDHDEHAGHAATADATDADVIEAQLMHYPIGTCIVAGGELGSMGEPVNYVHEGRLVRFCCAMCEPTFKKDPEKFLSELDKKIVAQQVDTYPLDTCVVSGGKLGSMGDPIEHIHQNRLVRFCCASCVPTFEKNPEKYTAMLDKAYADAQRADYPLDTCVVAGSDLGSMGEPAELVAGTTLVRFCCAGCFGEFRSNPSEYMSKLHR
ncbi:MAG: hypothetical protein RLN60_00770 [Phycisphaerales bacterium]